MLMRTKSTKQETGGRPLVGPSMVIYAEDCADQFQFKGKGNTDVLDPINQSMFCAQLKSPQVMKNPLEGSLF